MSDRLKLVALPAKVRVWIIALVILFALGLLAFRYRVAEIEPVFTRGDSISHIGLIRYLSSDFLGAAKIYKARQAEGKSAESRYGFPGLAQYLQGDFDSAEAIASKAIAQSDNISQARITLSQIALARSQFAQAQELAEINIASGVQQPFNAHVNAGLAAAQLADYSQAFNHFDAATRQGFRGNRDSVMLTLMETIGTFKDSGLLEREPALAATMLRLLSFWDPLIIRDAESYARKALLIGNHADEAWLVIGAAHFSRRQFDAALTACKQALKLNPKHADVYWLQMQIQSARGDVAQEIASALNAFYIAPNDYFIADGTMRVLSEKVGDYPGISEIGKLALANGTPSARTYVWLGYAATYLGNHAEALSHYLAADKLRPHDADIVMRVAHSYQETGDKLHAIASAEQAANLNRNSNAPFELIADVYFRRGDYHAAYKAHEAGFAREAPSAHKRSGYCVALLRGEQYEKAATCIEDVLRIDPENALANRLQQEVNENRDLARLEKKGGPK